MFQTNDPFMDYMLNYNADSCELYGDFSIGDNVPIWEFMDLIKFTKRKSDFARKFRNLTDLHFLPAFNVDADVQSSGGIAFYVLEAFFNSLRDVEEYDEDLLNIYNGIKTFLKADKDFDTEDYLSKLYDYMILLTNMGISEQAPIKYLKEKVDFDTVVRLLVQNMPECNSLQKISEELQDEVTLTDVFLGGAAGGLAGLAAKVLLRSNPIGLAVTGGSMLYQGAKYYNQSIDRENYFNWSALVYFVALLKVAYTYSVEIEGDYEDEF